MYLDSKLSCKNLQGLDGCGKSTQVKLLASKLEAQPLATPPSSMTRVRECFDRHGGHVARAFYVVSNYVLAWEIMKLCQEHGDFDKGDNNQKIFSWV